MLSEISKRTAQGERVLDYDVDQAYVRRPHRLPAEHGIRVRYLHSDIGTVERTEIIRDLRLGAFDVLVGINLLREGLDMPEVSLVAILDADKEGFLRSERSLDSDDRTGGPKHQRNGNPVRRQDDRLNATRHGRNQRRRESAGRAQQRARHHA